MAWPWARNEAGLAKGSGRRAARKSARRQRNSPAAASELLFETFEPRVLLNAGPLAAPIADTVISGPTQSSVFYNLTAPLPASSPPGGQTINLGDGDHTLTIGGYNNTITLGTGTNIVSGPVGHTTVTAGDGNNTISLGGANNVVTTGKGADLIIAGSGGDTVHSGAGDDTVLLSGSGNLVDAGPGNDSIFAGSGGETFVLNSAGQGTDSIFGFGLNLNDTFDLTAALAGTSWTGDTGKLNGFVRTTVQNTDLSIVLDPAGGSGGSAIAVLRNALPVGTPAGSTLHLSVPDSGGKATAVDLILGAGAPSLTAKLANDTGASASDGLTSDDTVAGKVTSAPGLKALTAGLDGTKVGSFTDFTKSVGKDGSFTLSAAQLDTLAGGKLVDGAHALHLLATDVDGNASTLDLQFTLATTAPAVTGFGLTSGSDTGTKGDNITSAGNVVLGGTSQQGVTLKLGAQTVTAGAGGTFQIPNVALADGDNVFSLTATDAAGNSSDTPLTVTRTGTLAADMALTWNQITLEAIRQLSTYPPDATRILAMVSLAQYDTLAAIEGTPAYLVQRTVTSAVSTDAALAQAAYMVLYSAYPSLRTALAADLAASLATVADGAEKTAGIALGQDIGQTVVDLRANDGSANFVDFTGSTKVGEWQPTAPMFDVAIDPQWQYVTPFALTSANQFDPGPPPALDSAEYAASVNKTQSLGEANSATRTADQTAIAQFWNDGGGSYTPPGHWNQVAQTVAQAKGNSLSANVRLFAQLNVAMADSAIADWAVKYTYNFWRPIQAIPGADLDGNPDTTADPNWRPLLITPAFPEYASGHSTFSMAAATVLGATFGDSTPFSLTSYTYPGPDGKFGTADDTRSYTSFTEAAQEAGESRIYGGIHWEFSNQIGQVLGKNVADAVLARFAVTTDTQAPSVIGQTTPAVTKNNVTLKGQLVDNLSGVASAEFRIDGGVWQNLTFDAQDHFTVTTAFKLDGSNDGAHSIQIDSKDAAGNLSALFTRNFTLDTKAPSITLSSLKDGDALTTSSTLTGAADPTGSELTGLNYTIDGGTTQPVTFTADAGVFDQVIPVGNLDIGKHALVLTATDAAGNSATLTRNVTVAALAPFTVTAVTPDAGAVDVGSTYRPRITFSRAVNKATLTANSLYATAADGSTLPTTIAPATDGSYAWVLFNSPMPGGATITLHVIGSAIRAAADGAFLDGDGDGKAGGDLTWSFTTVSLSGVAGTKLVGRVVDPGPDLLPMTFDDVRRGPDGIIHTTDDVYLNPIAGATVFILGQESQTVLTDKNGYFELDNVPVGHVKLSIDGRTATNAPTGVFWPEMVMDLTLRPGVTNTVMGSMGPIEEQVANADFQATYLPRVGDSVLQNVSSSDPTTVTVDANAAPQLTDEQRNLLTLTVQPGSALDSDGKAVDNAKIGVSLVPPQLVKDMLPPGVLQHTFDITIQAPGVSVFDTPVQITFPNVFNAAPGTKLEVLSFDHTTGMLVINGTATVSADGKYAISDPGMGVLAPGWHGLTPPNDCGGSGGPPPPPPPPDPTEQVTDHDPVALDLITGDTGATSFAGFTWNAPPQNPNVPPLPPIPGCDVPPHTSKDPQQPFINVTIQIDGPLATFAKPGGGGLPLVSQAFTLSPGTGVSKTFNFTAKTYDELFGANKFQELSRDQLYGSQIKITVVNQHADGSRTRDNYTYYQYRWVDVVDADQAVNKAGSTAAFFKTLVDGVTTADRDKFVDAHLPGGVTTDYTSSAPFEVADPGSGDRLVLWHFKPTAVGDSNGTAIKFTVNDAKLAGGGVVGQVTTIAKAVGKTIVSMNMDDKDGYKVELKRVLTSLNDVVFPGADKKFGTKDDFTQTLYVYTGHTAYADMVIGGQHKWAYNGVAKNGPDYRIVSNPFATEFAGFMPSDRGAGADGIKGTTDDTFSAAQLTSMDTFIGKQADALYKAVTDDYSSISSAITFQRTNAGANVPMTWQDLGGGLFGGTTMYDYNRKEMQKVMGTQGRTDPVTGNKFDKPVSDAAQEWALAQYLNQVVNDSGSFAVGINLNFSDAGITFAQYVANTVAHEVSHTFGLNEGYYDASRHAGTNNGSVGGTAKVNNSGNAFPYDIMSNGQAADPYLQFKFPTTDILKAATGLESNFSTPLDDALKMWRDNFNLDGVANIDGIRITGPDDILPEIQVLNGGLPYLGDGSETLDFGTVGKDGVGGAFNDTTLTLFNYGAATLTLTDAKLAGAASDFSIITAGIAGQTIAPQSSFSLDVRFDPLAIGNLGNTLIIDSDAASAPVFELKLDGQSISATPDAVATAVNNNLGGDALGAGMVVQSDVATIRNDGAQPLTISSISFVTGSDSFDLTGLPADLSKTPITLNTGQTFSFGADFHPGKLGLTRGLIDVATNDPNHSVLQLAVDGTGLPQVVYPQWGNDYVEIDTPNVPSAAAIHALSDSAGNFMLNIPAGQAYHLSIFDPVTGLIASDYGMAPPSGKGIDLTSSLVFGASLAPDTDFDGLPDDIEAAIGTNPIVKDTNKDGIDDFTAIQQGIDPLSGVALSTGIVSATTLKGTADAVAVTGSAGDPTKLTAYVATGDAGLAIVDATKFTKPSVLAELDLPGTSTDVAVDQGRNLAVVAGNEAGLFLVDVANPAAPTLRQTVTFPAPAVAATISDGIAYVATGSSVATVDLNTGDVRQSLDLGGATLTDVVFDGKTLFTMDSAHMLRAVSVDGDALTIRGSITLGVGSGRIFVGGNVAYAGGGSGLAPGGYETVDISNLDNLQLLSGVDVNGIAGLTMALNGSGLGIAVGSNGFVFGGYKALDVVNVSDPTNTGAFISRVDLPDAPNDVTLANGIAFVADAGSGLQIVNYAALDTKGVPPSVSISVDAVDVDPATPGVQVLEGRTVSVLPTVTDDVQVRNVEMLVNGTVVANDASYPFELTAQAPTIASGGKSMTIEVRATDTGGNVTVSSPVTLDVVPDTFPPNVTKVSVADGAHLFFVRSIEVNFDEPLDLSRLSTSGITLVNKGADGIAGTADDIAIPITLNTRSFGQSLSILPTGFLLPADYELRIEPSVISDNAGNFLTAPIVRDFTIRPASDVQATFGVPAISQAPSANPGQVIGLAVPFDPSQAVATFPVIDASGATSTREVTVSQSDAAHSIAYFTVPTDAITGDAEVFQRSGGTDTHFPDGPFFLQIVPVVSSIDVTSVASDGSTAQVTLTGLGFIEGNNTEYDFGTTAVVDSSTSSGPDVTAAYPNYIANGTAYLTLPLSAGSFGPITVKTAGGVSAPLILGLSGVTGTALSGTPTLAGKASANPGQAVTLTGTGLSTGTDVLLTYVDSNGTQRMVLLNPTEATVDGTSATLVVPKYANGAFALQTVGSNTQPLLQIVPTLTSYDVSGGTLRLRGNGFVEGNATYEFPGATVTDTASNSGPDVSGSVVDNDFVYITEPQHGFGNVSVTTAGGTSALFSSNELQAGHGYLRDVAFDTTNNRLWVIDNANPAQIHRVDMTTGQDVQTITLTAAFGSTAFFGGMQVVPSTFTLGSTSVAAGSLLLFDGQNNPDTVVAVDTSKGTVITTLALTKNYDLTAGVYDPTSKNLIIVDRSVGPNRIVSIDPTTGAEVSSFTAPFNAGGAGLALDPTNGNLWYGSDQSTDVVELTTAGVEQRRFSLALQGANEGEVNGLVFDGSGNLMVASSQGVVYRIDLGFDPAVTKPTLTQVVALAPDGTPADKSKASANVGQVIELDGTNFGPGTEVVFNTRDASGNVSQAAAAPLSINAAGTVLQVQVPDLATTGDVEVVNVGSQNLGFSSSYNDAIYRNVTLNFTAGSSNAVLSFADGGLEGVDNESWGLDNVSVNQGATTVFSDNFESGAQPQWSQSAVDGSVLGVFSHFSGRFSNASQTLSLSGLTSGQSYTLHFDLYVLDSWDGTNTSAGPDIIQVSADGKTLMRDAFSSFPTSVQEFNASAAVRLQIVPTLTGINGRPGVDSSFDLLGSGFMEGNSTITIGGVSLPDTYNNQNEFDVFGTRNSDYRVTAPLVVEGPITVTTDGGSAQIAGPNLGNQPLVQFTGIQATAEQGAAADAAKPSANTGQTITLQGQGFTYQTLVQFTAVDDTGVSGTVTRTGGASGDGKSLTVVVPALARSGSVHVLGTDATFDLQVVPTLRSVGGTVGTGNTVILEGTGLVGPELTVQIDGRGVGAFSVRTLQDTTSSSDQITDQQLLTLTVPSGVGAGVITVGTLGGTSVLRTHVSTPANADIVAATDVGDTLALSTDLGLAENQQVKVKSTVGDGAQGNKDVDLYRVTLAAGDRLNLSLAGSTVGYAYLRIFDDKGAKQIDPYLAYSTSSTPLPSWTAPTAGNYFIGVSGYSNSDYDPNTAGSGSAASYTGAYQLTVERQIAGSSHLASMTASAASGTPAQGGVASSNVGQTITLSGANFVSSDQVIFTAVYSDGSLYERTVAPATIAGDGTSLTVVVPNEATTGSVRLLRDSAGLLLQVVPTLSDVTANVGSPFTGQSMQLSGSGFAEGTSAVLFGGMNLQDTSRSSGIDVSYGGSPNYIENARIYLSDAPNGVPTGPIRVSTPGGTSDAFALSFSGIVSTASTGTPADAGKMSANPGQSITIQGSGLDGTTDVVFETVDSSGNRGQIIARPSIVDASGTSAQVVVPASATTGVVRVVGDTSATDVFLQIVPVVSSVNVTSVDYNTSIASVTLNGLGFVEGNNIEGNNSEYTFGSTLILDSAAGAGPDVTSATSVSLGLPLNAASFGPITVKTNGGVSAPFSLNFTGVTSVALSGTPADAGKASANPGQAVTLTGTGLSTSTDVLLTYVDNGGTQRTALLNPTAAAGDGTSATLVVPMYANGVFALRMVGSTAQPVLQIVPTLTSYNVTGTNALQLWGSGLLEGAATYQFTNGSVVDTATGSGPDVNSYYYDNNYVNLTEPQHGFGNVTVTTTGGTSAPLLLNEVETGQGALGDVALDASTGQFWVSDNANPGKLDRVDPTTGQVTLSFTMTGAFGTPYMFNYAGLQIAPAALTLGGTAVPAGSLLVFNGYPNPDTVTAVNPTSGAVIASVALGANYDLRAGVYDAASGHLFVMDARTNPAHLVEIDASTATPTEVGSFAVPFNSTSWVGLAIDPGNGDLWYGSDQSTEIVELTKTGVEVRRVNLALQGADQGEISGLTFDGSGNLLVSSTQGVVYRVNLGIDLATTKPTLTQVVALAPDGTPADKSKASANVGQVIELDGTNFGRGTQVVFNTRDNAGNVSQVGATPLSINAAGTALQVQVPALATTGNVEVVNVGSQNLGYWSSYNDSIYRNVTLNFTAGSSNAVLSFSDGGLEGVDNESWGIDNVSVNKGATTVFSDDFESGAKANWSFSTVDASTKGVFSRFSGRFSNATQMLSLSGLTSGKNYTLHFDLYILDSWDGNTSPYYGPDLFQVSADGTTLMRDTFTNYPSANVPANTPAQTYNASAGIPLQIVPTLTGLANGRPGSANAFDLLGSGFMAGGSTITVGGETFPVVFSTPYSYPFSVTGGSNNDFRITTPLTLDGPVTINTAGGSATLAGPVFGNQPPAEFDGIQANLQSGKAANNSKASANAGQMITLLGQGFSNSTLVQFEGVDDTGAIGTITRTGTANSNGTQLTLPVPELARTGQVHVLGAATSVELQVVPLLRAIGGTVAAGNKIELDGTGLVRSELSVQIDGKAVGAFNMHSVADGISSPASNSLSGQQLLTLTVPSGVSAGLITVTTKGGTNSMQTGITLATSTLSPAADVGDTLATAQTVTLPVDSQLTVNGQKIGDGTSSPNDVDLYKVTLAAGDQLLAGLSGSSYTHLRIFDAAGGELLTQYFSTSGTQPTQFNAPANGTYYVGVSGYYDTSYDPTKAGSGSLSYTGTYQLVLQRLDATDTRLTAISATAGTGTPAQTGVASANTGETITLLGSGLLSSDRVLFSAIDYTGSRYTDMGANTVVAADGNSLTVTVPDDATTGMVRLQRDTAGLLLQIVPTLTHVDGSNGSPYNGSQLNLTGSGFAEGASTVHFGTSVLADTSINDGLDVSYPYYYPPYTANSHISLYPTPNGVPTGPISVSTEGGTSEVYGLTFTGLTGSASTGTPTDGGKASANPGQTITIQGTGLDTTTDVVFSTVDGAGNRSQVIVTPATASADGKSATVVVPANAITDFVRVVGDADATEALLQIVPVVTGVTVTSVASDGSSAGVTLTGAGFIAHNDTEYRFGSNVVLDATQYYQGPEGYSSNSSVNLTLYLNPSSYGPVTVKTAGGTSAPFSFGTIGVTGTAATGTPADAGKASVNPGDSVTLTGTGLTTTTGVLLTYTAYDGSAHTILLNPTAPAADGTSATLTIPAYANGAPTLRVLGSSTQPVLQIVPTLTSYDVTGGNLQLFGRGFVEGNTSYQFAGATVTDTAISGGPDVYYSDVENGRVYITEPQHGLGPVTVTTAGGTSAALTLNELNPAQGYLRDVAFDTTNNRLWVVDNGNPAKIDRVNIDTGQIVQSVTLTAAYGSTAFFGGLQVVPSTFTLGSKSVAAGSLLLFDGQNNPDTVVAVDPSSGTIINTLALGKNYDLTAGVYDPTSKNLIVVDRSVGPNRIVSIDPTTGAEVSSFTAPFNAGEAGLAIDPSNGNLWYGSDQSTKIDEIDSTGSVIAQVDLAPLGANEGEITGLAFNNAGTLLVSSSQGVVYQVTV